MSGGAISNEAYRLRTLHEIHFGHVCCCHRVIGVTVEILAADDYDSVTVHAHCEATPAARQQRKQGMNASHLSQVRAQECPAAIMLPLTGND